MVKRQLGQSGGGGLMLPQKGNSIGGRGIIGPHIVINKVNSAAIASKNNTRTTTAPVGRRLGITRSDSLSASISL